MWSSRRACGRRACTDCSGKSARGSRRATTPSIPGRSHNTNRAGKNRQYSSQYSQCPRRTTFHRRQGAEHMTRLLHRLAQPWARAGSAYSIPGTLVVKLCLGEAPEHLPSLLDVRRNVSEPASFLNVEPVDRILKHFTDDCWVSRLHSSMRTWNKMDRSEDEFDDVEHAIGLSRTLHLEVDDECSIANLIDALRQLAIVEEASPQYLCSVPFGTMVQALDPAEARWPREEIHAPEAMAFEPGDATVIVGIVDTGVERHHPELKHRLRSGFNTVDFDRSDLATGI